MSRICVFSVFLRYHASLAKGGVEDVAHESCKLLVLNLSVVINYDWSRIDQLDMSSFCSEESSVLRFIGILYIVAFLCPIPSCLLSLFFLSLLSPSSGPLVVGLWASNVCTLRLCVSK